LFYRYRDSYIIRQRNFKLTFIGGIATFIYGFIGFIPQIVNVPCPLNVYNVNVLNIFVLQIFFSRSLRVILAYRLNIYKVTSIKRKKIRESLYGEKEPNNYLPKIYKKINMIIFLFISIPTLTVFLIIAVIHVKHFNTCNFVDLSDALIGLKNNRDSYFYEVVQICGRIYAVLGIITTICFFFVKDANKYGIKFECISTSLIITIFGPLNGILQNYATTSNGNELNKSHKRFFLDLFDITKGGKIFFTIVAVYILSTSIVLPLVHCYRSLKEKDKYIQEIINTIQYFYKVLSTPGLLNELRDIAIKEFSVENVLFWENYLVLQKMIHRYKIEYNKAKEMGDEKIISQYDFEYYYRQQLGSINTTSSIEGSSYDPSMTIPKQLLPYYTSFYYTFVDYEGPAATNLSGDTIRLIQDEFNSSCPTIGIFDTAKNEVVEMMFSSIYPILLRNNKRHFDSVD